MQYRGKKVVGPPPDIKNVKKKRKNRVVPYEELTRTQKFLRVFFTAIVYFVEKSLNYAFSYWLPPVYYVFFMWFIRGPIVANSGIVRDLIEIPITLFGLININGNFLKHTFSDVSLKTHAKNDTQCSDKRLDQSCGDGSDQQFNYCDKCKLYQVENSWHCKICDQCVVGRDYHCFMFNQCITRQNKRYHILGLFYASCALIFVSVYALNYTCHGDELYQIHNIPFVGKILSSVLFGFRYRFFLDAYGCWLANMILLINAPLFLLTFSIFVTNVRNVLQRTTHWESKKGVSNKDSWTDHVFEIRRFWFPLAAEVFGERWYLAIFSPFVSSPIPKPKNV